MIRLGIRNTFFIKVFMCFLALTVLFSLFYSVALSFFKQRIKNEILHTNRTVLRNASERFNSQLNRIKTLLIETNDNADLIGFNQQLLSKPEADVDYLRAKRVIRSLQSEIYKPQTYLETIIVQFKSVSFSFSHKGSSSADLMFGQLYASEAYSHGFGNDEPSGLTSFKLLPVGRFFINGVSKPILPITFEQRGRNYRLTALLDIEEAYDALVGSLTSPGELVILDKDGNELYRRGELPSVSLPALDTDREYLYRAGNYYFYERDAAGTSYVYVLPYKKVIAEMRGLTDRWLLIWAAVLTTGVVAAYFFSRRIQIPVKNLLSAVLNRKPATASSSIQEFDLIRSKINDLLDEREKIADTVEKQSTALTSYSYINRLKDINAESSEWQSLLSAEKSYVVVLYSFRSRRSHRSGSSSLDHGQEEGRRAMLERMDRVVTERFPDSSTFQIERDQFVSVIAEAEREPIIALMSEWKNDPDLEPPDGVLTIAIGTPFGHPSKFSGAYKQVQKMVGQAPLSEKTEIVTNLAGVSPFTLNPKQDHSLNAFLQSGNEDGAYRQLEQLLEQMSRDKASCSHFAELSDIVLSKVSVAVEPLQRNSGASEKLQAFPALLKECFTQAEYKQTFRELVSVVCELIREDKEEQDPVAALVMDILNKRFAQDLSLSYLADLLNMSSAYLSVYIKEKTGSNFSEHLNGIRVRKAQELLVTTEMNINDISLQVGYTNFTSFNRMFKKQTGMTPGEFRRRQIMQIHKSG
ncbi:helix-turn-helix domain-containing protein [Cohnella faecalis]|uniref:Helix-turn-helix domain-containing protein n=1 Tax=Cohnella faecalis TaxID=2315694 RepID=A0A398CI97_9BACL|nr:helix-turn-helix domain-containing protein [Cohnella faecalis]RIE02996.1 helix-turn-helix domain-containing protein [Cohnella faecalis]